MITVPRTIKPLVKEIDELLSSTIIMDIEDVPPQLLNEWELQSGAETFLQDLDRYICDYFLTVVYHRESV
jgi:hypothetical protein